MSDLVPILVHDVKERRLARDHNLSVLVELGVVVRQPAGDLSMTHPAIAYTSDQHPEVLVVLVEPALQQGAQGREGSAGLGECTECSAH